MLPNAPRKIFYPPSQKAPPLGGDECEEKAAATADFYYFCDKFLWRITRRGQTQKQFGEDGYSKNTAPACRNAAFRRAGTGLPVGIYIYLALSFFLFTAFLKAALAEPINWQEMKSDHFAFYSIQNEAFGKEVLAKAEQYYRDSARELGYERHSNFWTWDNRVKIYIYPSKESFLKATGQPEWSGGVADYTNKQIASFQASDDFLNSVLPHEICHLIFRDYVGFKGEVSLWLDEGMAQWMEPKKRELVEQYLPYFIREDKLIPLKDMLSLDIRKSSQDEKVHAYYFQSVALVSFFIREYGMNNFVNFCRQLRDGKNLEEALMFTYPTDIRSIDQLSEEWSKYLEKQANVKKTGNDASLKVMETLDSHKGRYERE